MPATSMELNDENFDRDPVGDHVDRLRIFRIWNHEPNRRTY
jgi:hypothetical protein